MIFRRAKIADIEQLSSLISTQNVDGVSSVYLKTWYWENPFQSHSIVICEEEGIIKGLASTNNFLLTVGEDKELVAFPQKVLTATEIRGQGYFTKLYFRGEQDNLKSENVNFFLTFTNSLSTPIFIRKFKFKIGICPTIAFLPPAIIFRSKHFTYKKVDEFSDTYFDENTVLLCQNGIVKDAIYHNWRYQEKICKEGEEYIKLAVFKSGAVIGYAVVKKGTKKNIPFFYLLDIITHDTQYISQIIEIARTYAIARFSFGLMLFINELTYPYINNVKLKFLLRNKLNFLVKGRTEDKTNDLSEITFNFSFGDLDFM